MLVEVVKAQVHYRTDRLACGHEIQVPSAPGRMANSRPPATRRQCWKCEKGMPLSSHEQDCK